MARMNFPKRVIIAVKKRANGKCEMCKAALKQGEGEVDHILADALRGKPVQSNARLLCRVCHKAKTNQDINKIRKADRQRNQFNGISRNPNGQKIQSRGFAKSGRKKAIHTALPVLPPREIFR